MSRAALQEMAGTIMDAFVSVGFADVGTYTAPGGSPIPVRVRVNDARAPFGSFGTTIGDADRVSLLLSEIPTPLRDAVIAVDGMRLKLVKMIEQNAAVSMWEVAVL